METFWLYPHACCHWLQDSDFPLSLRALSPNEEKSSHGQRPKEHGNWVCPFCKFFFKNPKISVCTSLPERCHRATVCCIDEVSCLGQSTSNFCCISSSGLKFLLFLSVFFFFFFLLSIYLFSYARSYLWPVVWDLWFFIAACKLLVAACGIQFPDQGSNLCPLQREHGILATGPPGESHEILLSVDLYFHMAA